MEFKGVIPPDLAAGPFWPQIADLLSQALPYGRGEYTLDDIKAGIEQGEMFAIGIVSESAQVQFVVTCCVVNFPQKRVLYVQYGAGRGGAQAKEALTSAARTLLCDWIETRCRDSVATLYRRVGFDTAYRVCILEIPQ